MVKLSNGDDELQKLKLENARLRQRISQAKAALIIVLFGIIGLVLVILRLAVFA